MPDECNRFYSISARERERLFPTYDLDKQLAIHKCGMARRPPDSSLALFIAARGESAIPILLERLEKEKDEQFQYGIIDIFEVISVKGYLRGKPEVIVRIRQVVIRMKTSIFRDLAQQSLNKIEKDNAG